MGSTVLCIDDRPHVLELRKATLESHGYCANITSNGHTALKMLEETTVAAVFAEVQTGRHGRRSRGLPYQATVSQPADHPAFSVRRHARANPVAGG
jgi:DNA-binding NtrC family response regulator